MQFKFWQDVVQIDVSMKIKCELLIALKLINQNSYNITNIEWTIWILHYLFQINAQTWREFIEKKMVS